MVISFPFKIWNQSYSFMIMIMKISMFYSFIQKPAVIVWANPTLQQQSYALIGGAAEKSEIIDFWKVNKKKQANTVT